MYKEPPIKCLNSFVLVVFFASISIFHDLVILVMPLPILWGLQLQWKKKAHAMVMFSVGLFVIICSSVRVPILLRMKHTMDPSCKFLAPDLIRRSINSNLVDQAPVALWSYLEQAVGIICGCLPAFRSLVVTMLPKLKKYLGSTNGNRSKPASYGLADRSISSQLDPRMPKSNSADIELGRKGTSQEHIIYETDRTSDESDHFRLVPVDTNGNKIGTRSTVTADEVYSVHGTEIARCPRKAFKARRESKSGINVTQTVQVMKK